MRCTFQNPAKTADIQTPWVCSDHPLLLWILIMLMIVIVIIVIIIIVIIIIVIIITV